MDDDCDSDDGERQSTGGARWVGAGPGCLAAFLFALPIGAAALFAAAMGECMGDPNCGESKRMAMATNLAVVLALAALFGLSIRVLVRRSRLRGTEAAPRAWAVALAFPYALVVGLLALWLSWQFWG